MLCDKLCLEQLVARQGQEWPFHARNTRTSLMSDRVESNSWSLTDCLLSMHMIDQSLIKARLNCMDGPSKSFESLFLPDQILSDWLFSMQMADQSLIKTR